MRLIVSKFAGAAWPAWLEKFQGSIYQSIEWAETRLSVHSSPLYFHWMDDNGHAVGIAVGIESWSPIRYVGRFSKRLDLEAYPVAQGNDIALTRSMIKQIVNFARREGFCSIAIQSYGTNVMVPDMANLGFETTPRIEFILDLTMSDDELWHGFSEHHRRKIKKADKHSLILEELCTVDAMRQFRRLQIISSDRRLQRGENIGLLDDTYYEDIVKRYFEKNLGKIFLLIYENEAVSGALVSLYAGRAYYVYGGSSDTGFQMNAPALLFWKILSRCRDLGCREFNLGGVPASSVSEEAQSHGLYRFKAGFGGRQVKCLSGSMENLRPIRAALVKVAKKGWNLWKSW
jgi:lipid II:glycine glycyltransferase (peptidoglycan interpeptide bridge formation enzyme)